MSRSPIGRPTEILLVEDNLDDARVTIQALKHENIRCRVSLVRDGEEALSFLRREGVFAQTPEPDVILLDMELPKKDGRAGAVRAPRRRAAAVDPGAGLDRLGRSSRGLAGAESAHRRLHDQAGQFGSVHPGGQIAAPLAFDRARASARFAAASARSPRV